MIPFYGNHDEEISLFEEIELNVSPALKRGDYMDMDIYIYTYISRRKNVRLKGKIDTSFLYANEIEFSLFQLNSK